MAATFPLPSTLPPGNIFPGPSSSDATHKGLSPVIETATPTSAAGPGAGVGSAAGVEFTMLKPNTRPVLVEVTETAADNGPATPEPSDFPPPPTGAPPANTARPRTPKRHAPPQLTIHTGATRTSPPRKASHEPAVVQKSGVLPQEVEQTEPTPVMRSMFPQFDPTAPVPQPQQQLQEQQPLQQQRSTSSLENVPPPPAGPPPGHYSPSLYSQPARSPPVQAQPSISRAPTINGSSPLRIAEQPPPDLSSGEELLDLWTVANGQDSHEAKDTYTLGLFCENLSTDQEMLHFTSNTTAVYSLHASGGTVVLTRTHPLNPEMEITICRPNIQQPTITSPLLATIFPTLAELMALDTASNIAITHRLTRADSQALQTEALARAHASETAQLLWDSDSATYYLAHPSLSTATETSAATLPIRITPQAITLHGADGNPILSFSLLSQTLTLHVPAILLLSPSLYTLDTLLSTILTLLLHLHRKTALLGSTYSSQTLPQQPLPHFDPPPTSAAAIALPSRAKTRNASTSNKVNRWFSSSSSPPTPPSISAAASAAAHRATTPHLAHGNGSTPTLIQQRSPALSGSPTPRLGAYSPAPSQFHFHAPASQLGLDDDKDLEAGGGVLAAPMPGIPAAGVAPELRKSTTGVDLSRFQAYDLSDPSLGRGTRVMLRVLYWGFGVLVWCLGVGVGVIAAGVVALGGLGGKGDKGARREVVRDKKGRKAPKEIELGRVG